MTPKEEIAYLSDKLTTIEKLLEGQVKRKELLERRIKELYNEIHGVSNERS